MSAGRELADAVVGWVALVRGQPAAAARFQPTPAGLANAAGCFFGIVLLTMLLQSALRGFPGWAEIVRGLLVNALPLIGVWAACMLTQRLLRPELPPLALVVPATYGMAFALVAALPLGLFPVPVAGPLLLGALGFMLFRLARGMAGLGLGHSLAFAALCLVLLVGLPLALYMVTT